MKSLLLICRQPPQKTALAQAAIDVALAAGIFEQPIAIAFMGDAVLQLIPENTPSSEKNLAAQIQALPLYGVDNIFIDQYAMHQHHIDSLELRLPSYQAIDNHELRQIMTHYDHVITL